MSAKIDAEVDLHGHTAATARAFLNGAWARGTWQSMRRVQIIHGTGEVLFKLVRQWADELSIPWTVDVRNAGVTILQPSLRPKLAASPTNRPFARFRDRLKDVVKRDDPPAAEGRRIKAGRSDASAAPARQEEADPDKLFDDEMRRLEGQDAGSVRRRKHGL